MALGRRSWGYIHFLDSDVMRVHQFMAPFHALPPPYQTSSNIRLRDEDMDR